ncbi:MAG: ABC transporter permease [Chloroflexi bacterium]|nr:ABC transporter permease [Chloroflexota bacterium]
MFHLLYRNLVSDRSRTILSLLAVGTAIMLLIVLEGFKVGLSQQIRSYRESLPVELIATPAATRSSIQTTGALPAAARSAVEAIAGVRQVSPLTTASSIFAHGGMKTPIAIIGYKDFGAPASLKSGRQVSAAGEIVMDYSLARKHGLGIGDVAKVNGREFRIAGLSRNTSSMLASYVFMDLTDAYSVLTPRGGDPASAGSPSLLLISVAPGYDPGIVRSSIEDSVPSVDVTTPRELAANDVAIIEELMGPAVNLMILVAYLVGILVIGLTLYANVFERLRDAGIMKALGAGNKSLYLMVLGQGVFFALAGLALGIGESVGVAALISWLVPQYLIVPLDPQLLLRAGLAGLVLASLASLLPIKQVAGVDPAMVFRQ